MRAVDILTQLPGLPVDFEEQILKIFNSYIYWASKILYNGKPYQFICLSSGLFFGPQKFTKLLKPPLASFRRLRAAVAAYINDLLHDAFVNVVPTLKKVLVC